MGSIQADVQNLGDATYVYITGPAGIPAGVHEVRIGDRTVRLYVNAVRDTSGSGEEG